MAAQGATSQLTIASTDIEGNDLIGKYVELRQNGTFVASGFTPSTFVIANATEYQVGIADFRQYVFDHWLDTGSTDRWRSIAIAGDTNLVAVYRIVTEIVTQTGSTGGGGGQSKAVMIIAPEEGEPVNPGGIGVSGVTIGNPTSVEIALRNPTTDISTPYQVVTPRSPGDFTWWSYSLTANDLTMTQIDVRAVFSDGDQRSDSVGIFYYTGSSRSSSTSSGGSTSIKILDSILVADVNASLANRDININTLTDTPSQDSDDVPDDGETAVNQDSYQTSFSLIIPLLFGLAVAAFLAWLLVRKRQALARQFKN